MRSTRLAPAMHPGNMVVCLDLFFALAGDALKFDHTCACPGSGRCQGAVLCLMPHELGKVRDAARIGMRDL